MNEFEWIASALAPLAKAPEALGLKDDVAVFGTGGDTRIITHDTLVQGTHFLDNDPLDSVGWRAIAANVSDLIAKGGEPDGFLLGLALPHGFTDADKEALISGTRSALLHFGGSLWGGDTTSIHGPLTLGVTAVSKQFGDAKPVLRSGGMAGDALFVLGTLNASRLGLQLLTEGGDKFLGNPDVYEPVATAIAAFRYPSPALATVPLIRRYARAAIDISDGIEADAAHLGAASGRGVCLEVDALPCLRRSQELYEALGRSFDEERLLPSDDYCPLIAVDPGTIPAFLEEALAAGIHATRIGHLVGEPGFTRQFASGHTHQVETPQGYKHF